MAKLPTIEEMAEQVKERVLEEILIDGEPLGKLIDSGDLVHIVRCKDCKWNKSDKWVDCPMTEMFGRTTDNYCSRAERKEEE